MPARLRCEIFPADVRAEHARVAATGWPLAEGLTLRPRGLTDFRLLDPSGYYWRVTEHAPASARRSSRS